jgi:predicted dehydrogenase
VTTPFRWGILGTGWIAEMFVTDLNALGIDIAAVGSRTQDAADAFAARFGIPLAHGSYEALVSDPEVDAIYVATPHPFHAENALLAIEAGKHVLIEKPFTLNAKEAARVAEAAAEADVVVLEAMWTRFLPHMRRIHEVIAAGTIGEVHTVLADHDQLLPSDPQHRINNPELGGGALLDLGIYPISLAVDILGLPTKIIASATKTETGVDRQLALIFEHDDNRSVLHTALDTLGPNRAAIVGTLGRIEIDPVWYTQTTFTVYDAKGEEIERFSDTGEARGMQFQARELERVVAEGLDESELLPLGQSVAIMAVLDEIRRQIGVVYPGE